MDKLIIEGPCCLTGEVNISGAKNAALPILAAALLTNNTVVLSGIPCLQDVTTMIELLGSMGVRFLIDDNMNVEVDASGVNHPFATYDLVKTMRASILVLGPLLSRFGKAKVSMPGGCAIGSRPIDIHLSGLQQMGANIEVKDGYVYASVDGRLQGTHLVLDKVTVTGTENLLMAAVLASGETVIENAAREPEVTDLASFLNVLGAKIQGIGTDRLVIHGVESLSGGRYAILPDRIEAGTFLIGAAMTRGSIKVNGICPSLLEGVLTKLRRSGANIQEGGDWIKLDMNQKRPKATNIITGPFPGFPTDLQAQWMALNAVAEGSSSICEEVFDSRFMHAYEMQRMGADLEFRGGTVIVHGKEKLHAAPVIATDLRASASLVLAGLVATGRTLVDRIYHIDRGYSFIEEKMMRLGAVIRRVPA